jgi:hypothetical protein
VASSGSGVTSASGDAGAPDRLSSAAPRLAFGPDGLMYSLLPPGMEFDNEPAASRPFASLLRISDEGRVPAAPLFDGIDAHPLGVAWHPSTGALWLVLPGAGGEVSVQTSAPSPVSGTKGVSRGLLRPSDVADPSNGALVVRPEGLLELAQAFPQGVAPASIGTVRLTAPVLASSVFAGLSDRITDLVSTPEGALYLATHDVADPGSGHVVLRLQLRAP